MALPARLQRPIRFTRDQRDRLKRAARQRGQTVQTFMAAAVMEAVADLEAELAAQPDQHLNQPASLLTQGGLFMRRNGTPPSPIAQTAAPVVVQVTSAANDLAARLAKKIADAPAHDRDREKQAVLAALRCVAASEAECAAWVQDLERELVRQLSQPGGLQKLRDAVRHLV